MCMNELNSRCLWSIFHLNPDKESFLLEFCPKCLDLVLKRQTNYLHGIEVCFHAMNVF